jgi:hypothetical protein
LIRLGMTVMPVTVSPAYWCTCRRMMETLNVRGDKS